MKKNSKYILIPILILAIAYFGWTTYVDSNEINEGASISWDSGVLNVSLNSDFSQEEVDHLTDICLKKRKDGIKANSLDGRDIGDPTNYMFMSIYNKSELISTKAFKYNLWLDHDLGYIQDQSADKIYRLNPDELQFFIDAYYKYYDEDDFNKMISNKKD